MDSGPQLKPFRRDSRSSEWIVDFINEGGIFSKSANEVVVCYGGFTWNSVPKSGQQALYINGFFLESETPWVHSRHCRVVSLDDLESLLEPFRAEIAKPIWHPYSRERYTLVFDELQSRFRTGKLRKNVPIIFEYAHQSLSAKSVSSLLLNLVGYAKGAPVRLYGFWTREQGMLGATPEVLFEIPQKGLLRTMALASTQPSTADGRNLFKCEKLLKEHQVVVKSIKKSLGHHGVVKVCNTRTLKLPNLTHLLTPIELTYTSDLSFLDLIRSLHPTPALGGAPRIAGWKWLKSLQKYGERRFFGAPFGIILKDGFMCSLVAIRGIQWVQDRLQISAGAGVLPESNVEAEWHELNLKITAIKRLLGFEQPPLCMDTMSNPK